MISAPKNNRGSRRVYTGSIEILRGLPVYTIDDCGCPWCAHLDPWSTERRATVTLKDGIRLDHCRHESLTAPEGVCQYETEVGGPHPGCAEFDGGATNTVTCVAAGVAVFQIFDHYAAQVVPDEAESTMVLCAEHADLLRHEAATGTEVKILAERPISKVVSV